MFSHPVTALTLLSGLMACVPLAFAVLARQQAGLGMQGGNGPTTSQRGLAWGAVLLGCGLVLVWRLALAGQGFELRVDAGTFRAWALAVASNGASGLYASTMMVDYPPVYLAVLGALGKVAGVLGVPHDAPVMARILLVGPLVAEVAMGLIVVRMIGGPLGIRRPVGCALVALVLLLPHVVANSSLFGQVDAAPAVFVVAAAAALATAAPGAPGLVALSAVLFVIAVLTKPIALFALPVGAIWACTVWWSEEWRGRWALVGALLSAIAAATAVIVSAAAFELGTARIIIAKCINVVSSYPYASLNAANLYALMGLNWRSIDGGAAAANMPAWLGVNLWWWGRGFLAAAILFVTGVTWREARYWRTRQVKTSRSAGGRRHGFESLLFLIGVLSTLVFCFVDQMHERYLYLGATSFALAAMVRPRPIGVVVAVACSLLAAVNTSLFLDFHVATGGYHVDASSLWLKALATAHLLLAAGVVAAAWNRSWMHDRPPLTWGRATEDAARPAGFSASGLGRRLRDLLTMPALGAVSRAEVLALVAVTVIGLALSFVQLGTRTGPKSFYRPARAGPGNQSGPQLLRRYVLLPALAPGEPAHIAAFFGLGKGHYLFRGSGDGGTTWVELGRLGHETVFDGMSWRSLEIKAQLPLNELAVVFEPASDGDTLAIHEMGVFATATLNTPAARLELAPQRDFAAAAPDPLVDEPAAIPERPSFLDEMIFDEVYHARSAWEEILGVPITETSHPPLGKTLISVGMSIFGFGTGGWRFVGALMGAMAVPLVWLIARLASGSAPVGLLAAWFFCFDFLRHTQARMATIDSITLLFVLAAFGATLSYVALAQQQVHSGGGVAVRDGVWRWLCLLVGGVCFGMGAASKWSALYAAPALVLLFGIGAASAMVIGSAQLSRTARRLVVPDAVVALICYVAVPLVIYFGAFVLSHSRSGEMTDWMTFWERQKSMYRYHSELKATHPFSSPWWEWPLSLRPLWLYSGQPSPPGVHPEPLVRSIVSMGHPLTWWGGVIACVWLAYNLVKRILVSGIPSADDGSGRTPPTNRAVLPAGFTAIVLLLCPAALYLPWVVAPRELTFIYHYLPVVPFVLMILALALTQLAVRSQKVVSSATLIPKQALLWRSPWIWASALATTALYVWFFPILSGIEVQRNFINEYLRWLPRWDF